MFNEGCNTNTAFPSEKAPIRILAYDSVETEMNISMSHFLVSQCFATMTYVGSMRNWSVLNWWVHKVRQGKYRTILNFEWDRFQSTSLPVLFKPAPPITWLARSFTHSKGKPMSELAVLFCQPGYRTSGLCRTPDDIIDQQAHWRMHIGLWYIRDHSLYLGGSENGGTPKWFVFNGQSH